MSYEIKLDGMNELRKALMNKANSVNPKAVARVVKQNTAECVTKAKNCSSSDRCASAFDCRFF